MPSSRFSDDNKYRIFFWIVCGVALAIVLLLIIGLAVKFLWNATIADVLDVGVVSFWQALGLFVLAKLFFGIAGGPRSRFRRRKRPRAPEGPDSSLPGPVDDDSFRRYWREEGRAAYEAFLAARQERSSQDPSSGADR